MMRTHVAMVTVPFVEGGFEPVDAVAFEDLEQAFDEAVAEAGLDPASSRTLDARHHLIAFAEIVRRSTWGEVLKAEHAHQCLTSALDRAGADRMPIAPPARRLH